MAWLPVLWSSSNRKSGRKNRKSGRKNRKSGHKNKKSAHKQEVNKVLKTGFLFYGLTTCVIGRCKQILTYLLLSAIASLDIASLTKTTNLHLWTVTAYWRLIILSWANSRLGVPDRLDCQGWLNLPDILVFVLLCFLKKSFQVLISLGDFLLKKPKGAALWSDVYPLLFQGFVTLASWAILCSGLR